MKFFTVISTVFVFLYEFQGSQSAMHWTNSDEESPTIKTAAMIQKFGYPSETHTVETEDGYILTMHRIPYSKDSPSSSSTRSIPVFLQHGLLGSSLDFFLISTADALPFVLSDLGFDVWLGNARGNRYSRKHKELSPSSNQFWNYTWHESGVYDIPAMINYVLHVTQRPKVAYIGFSAGTTMYFVLTATQPEFQRKIETALLMAPMAYVSNIKSPLLRFLAPISKSNGGVYNLIATGEFLPSHYVFQLFRKYFCAIPVVDQILCTKYMFLIFGSNLKGYNPASKNLVLNHFPAGYSAKALIHYAQLIKSGKFQQFDYGTKRNFLTYESSYPPEYKLSENTVPIYLYAAKDDFLSPIEDVNYTAAALPNLQKLTVVEQPKFSHLDFLGGIDVRNLVYNPLVKDMLQQVGEDQ